MKKLLWWGIRVAFVYMYKERYLEAGLMLWPFYLNSNSRTLEPLKQVVLGQVYSTKDKFPPVEWALGLIRNLSVAPITPMPLLYSQDSRYCISQGSSWVRLLRVSPPAAGTVFFAALWKTANREEASKSSADEFLCVLWSRCILTFAIRSFVLAGDQKPDQQLGMR